MRLALVGCGAVSRKCYVPALKRSANHSIEWFVDANLERAKELANDYGHGRVAQDHKEAIASVDAAIVAVPNYLHAPVSIDFLREGRHVLCEKPVATKSSDALLMIEASEKSGARLGVNLIRRRYFSHRLAKSLLERDLLGDLTQVCCKEGRVYSWDLSSSYLLDRSRAGGGVLVDWGTHMLDTIQWLLDANLDLVSYDDDSHGGVEANCEVTLNLTTEGKGIPCQILLSRTRAFSNNVVINGKGSSLEIHDSDPNGVYMRTDGQLLRICSSDSTTKSFSDVDWFAEQVTAFLDGSTGNYPTGRDALKCLTFIEDCYRKAQHKEYSWEQPSPSYSRSQLSHPNHTVLVIGASGFLGTRLVEKLYLERGLDVRAGIHRPATAARLARYPVKFVDCDLLDKNQVSKALDGCDMVVNCAAESTGDKRKVLDVLVKGTSNLLEAAVDHELRKLVHVSTAAVQGFGGTEESCGESSPVFSRDPYVRGKSRSEKIVMAYAQSIPVVILRPTLIYGPYSSSWSIRIINNLRDGVPMVIGDRGLANLVYVDDVADAILQALLREEAKGQTFIINDPQSTVSWAEYVQKYANELGISPRTSTEYNLTVRRIRNSLFMLRDSIKEIRNLLKSPEFLALLTSVPILIKLGTMLVKGEKRKGMETMLSSELQIPKPNPKILQKYESVSKEQYKVLTCRSIFSSSKAESLIGFKPQVSLDEGIKTTLAWARWAGYLKET